jgi:hypothetical protein
MGVNLRAAGKPFARRGAAARSLPIAGRWLIAEIELCREQQRSACLEALRLGMTSSACPERRRWIILLQEAWDHRSCCGAP